MATIASPVIHGNYGAPVKHSNYRIPVYLWRLSRHRLFVATMERGQGWVELCDSYLRSLLIVLLLKFLSTIYL